MPKPLFIMSFSPGGTASISDQVNSPRNPNGQIYVDARYENDNVDDPTAYRAFDKNFNEMRRNNFFDNFASFALDGFTELGTAMVWAIVKRDGRLIPSIQENIKMNKEIHGTTFGTWQQLLNFSMTLSKQINALPIHTAITCHMDRDKDEVLMTFVKSILYPGQSKVQVPGAMMEVYYLMSEGEGAQNKRYLLTQNTGEYHAGTRMGSKGKLQVREVADIRALLKKCNYDWEDKNGGNLALQGA